jgi:hypothetical protein
MEPGCIESARHRIAGDRAALRSSPPMLILPGHILQLRCGDGDRRALRSRKVAVSRLRTEGAGKICNEAGLDDRPRRRRAELSPDRRCGPLEPPCKAGVMPLGSKLEATRHQRGVEIEEQCTAYHNAIANLGSRLRRRWISRLKSSAPQPQGGSCSAASPRG